MKIAIMKNFDVNKNQNRQIEIDALKGVLAILVITGHAIQIVYTKNKLDFDESALFNIIYSFHMPLFMFVSGYLFKPESKTRPLKKIIRLLLPFVAWALVYNIDPGKSIEILYNDIINTLINTDLGLWFLVTLAQIIALNQVFRIFSKSQLVINILLILTAILADIYMVTTNQTGFGLDQLGWMLPFFALGNLASNFPQLMPPNYKKQITILSLIVYLFLLMNFSRSYEKYNSIIEAPAPLDFFEFYISKYIIAISVILIIMLNIRTLKAFPQFLKKIGKLSLEFYASQFLFLGLSAQFAIQTNTNIFAEILLTAIMTTLLSLLFIMTTRKLPIVPKILFGNDFK